MMIKRNGVLVEIATGPEARKAAAEERVQQEQIRLAKIDARQQVKNEAVGFLLNRAVSKLIAGDLRGAASTFKTARQIDRN